MTERSATFETLPPEVFIRVIEKLSKKDMKALSLASKKWHPVVVEALWESVTIKSDQRGERDGPEYRFSVEDLPQTHLHLARQLRFCIDFTHGGPRHSRCPHRETRYLMLRRRQTGRDEEGAEEEGDDDDGSRLEQSCAEESQLRFRNLGERAKAMFETLRPGQLQSFSWDFGTCLPPEIFGPRGVIPLHHPQLRSLSLTTDRYCRDAYNGTPQGGDMDLSSLCHLRSLRWRAPHDTHLEALATAIKLNSDRLRHLEVDLLAWPRVWRELRGEGDADEDRGSHIPSRFCQRLFGLTRGPSSQPVVFAAIRRLSLTAVPLMPALADAINFDTLSSLTVRECYGWIQFFDRIMELRIPVRLKRLEIGQDLESRGGDQTVESFLGTFNGLEELCISYGWMERVLGLWDCAARHHRATLMRFVHHHIMLTTAPSKLAALGIPVLATLSQQLGQMREDPSRNPLAQLNLDFLSLSYSIYHAKTVLLPFRSKTSLKVFHIRRVSAVLQARAEDEDEDQTKPTGSDDDNDDDFDTPLRSDIRRLASWAFGPDGIPSLRVLLIGDFSYARGGRHPENNFILGRSTDEGRKHEFRRYHPDAEVPGLNECYRAAMGACPISRLLWDDESF